MRRRFLVRGSAFLFLYRVSGRAGELEGRSVIRLFRRSWWVVVVSLFGRTFGQSGWRGRLGEIFGQVRWSFELLETQVGREGVQTFIVSQYYMWRAAAMMLCISLLPRVFIRLPYAVPLSIIHSVTSISCITFWPPYAEHLTVPQTAFAARIIHHSYPPTETNISTPIPQTSPPPRKTKTIFVIYTDMVFD